MPCIPSRETAAPSALIPAAWREIPGANGAGTGQGGREIPRKPTFRMADVSRNLFIFPHPVINEIVAVAIRFFQPLALDE